jgi:hypothetical protein
MARGRFKKPRPLRNRSGISTTLPYPAPNLEEFTEYIAAQENSVKSWLRRPEFSEVVGAIHQAYDSVRLVGKDVTPGLGRVCIVCHQSLFSAAGAIFRGVPVDSGGPSRRAVEAARTALALKLDPENAKRWLAEEERMSRWAARRAGEKPTKLRIDHKSLTGHLIADELQTFMISLSDSQLHFTPEFLFDLDFQPRAGGTETYSEYLETDCGEIAHHLGYLAAIHVTILKALDECANRSFAANAAYAHAIGEIGESVRLLKQKYPLQLPSELEN